MFLILFYSFSIILLNKFIVFFFLYLFSWYILFYFLTLFVSNSLLKICKNGNITDFKKMSPCLLDFYIYVYIKRERDKESIQQEINFTCKSFRQRLYQLHIYQNTATSIKLKNSFSTSFDRNTNIKKLRKRQSRQNYGEQYYQ